MTMCDVPWCVSPAPCPAHRYPPSRADACYDCHGTATQTVAGAPVACPTCFGSGRRRRVPARRLAAREPVDDRGLLQRMRPTE